MPETWYRISRGGMTIEKCEVVRSTDASLYMARNGAAPERVAKKSHWYEFYQTYAEARSALVYRHTVDVARAKDRLVSEEKRLRAVEMLPTDGLHDDA